MVSTITPIPRSPEEVALNIATKMDLARQSLFDKGEYLADPDILNRVLWEPVGSGHQLVIKPHHEAVPFIPESDDPTAEPSISPSLDNDDDDTSTNIPLPAIEAAMEPSDTPSTPAILSIVVQLVPGANWLYPDGKWAKGNLYTPHFQDVKLLCTGGIPQHPCFSLDFDTSINNLNAIMGRLGDATNKRSTITSSQPGAQVKIRHALFTVRSSLNAASKDLSDPLLISRMTIRKKLINVVCSSKTFAPDLFFTPLQR